MKKLILILVVAIVPLISIASVQSSASTVDMITVGETYVRVNLDAMTDAEGCEKQNFYVLDIAGGENKEQYAAILSAKTTQNEIYFLLDGCLYGYPKITHTYLK